MNLRGRCDELDRVLARHCGFTDEELEFSVNYYIKYRMGKTSADEDAEYRMGRGRCFGFAGGELEFSIKCDIG